MARSNKREKIILQTGDDRTFPTDLLASSQRLIPVQLPERPVSTSGLHSTLAPPSLPTFGEFLPGTNIRRAHSSSPGAYARRSRLDVHPPSPSSPLSELSKHSDESVLIVGDTFSAPTRLRISPEAAARFTDAGAVDDLQRSFSQTSLPSTSHLTSISPRPPQNEPSLSMPSSPYIQSRKLARSTIVASQGASSRSVHPIQPIPQSLSTSPLFLQDSPPKDLSSTSQPKRKSSRSRRSRRRRGSTVSTEPSSNTGSEPISEAISSSSSNLGQVTTGHQATSVRGSTNSPGLNPLAAAFEPSHIIRRRLPRPNELQPNPANEPVQATHPTQSALGYADLMLHPFHQQNLASIQHDLPHLRQWSNLFRHPDVPVTNSPFNQIQLPDRHNFQEFLAMSTHPRQEGEVFPMPVVPIAYNFGPSAYVPTAPQHAFSSHPHLPSASFRVPYNDMAMESAAQMTFSIPVVAPSHSQSFEFPLSQSLDNLEPHDIPGTSMANVSLPVSFSTHGDTEPKKKDVIRARLTDLGKSSLTPVTERSEVSTHAIMTPVYPTQEPMEEATPGLHSGRRRKKKKHGRRSKRTEPSQSSSRESLSDSARRRRRA